MTRRDALVALLFLLPALLAACGGGGGGLGPTGAASTTAPAHRLAVLFADPASAEIRLLPSRGGSPAPMRAAVLTIGGRAYPRNAANSAVDIPIADGETIALAPGFSVTPVFRAGEDLALKVIEPPAGATFASGVYYRAAAGGGVEARTEFNYPLGGATRVVEGRSEVVANGRVSRLLGDLLSRSEAEFAPNLEVQPPLLNNAALFASLAINPASSLTGELSLLVEPATATLGYGESVQLAARLRDSRGAYVEVAAAWSAIPPFIVDVDTVGKVRAKTVPGAVTVLARYENLYGSAEVAVVSSEAGTSLTGLLTRDTTLTPDTDYVVIGDLTIPAGVTLTVLGGTTVRFLAAADNTAAGENPARSELIVQGTLRVTGLETQYAIFRSSNLLNPERSDYFGIRVLPEGIADLSRLLILDALYGAKCDGGTLTMSRCRIRHGTVGVYATDDSTLRVEATEIEGCGEGINCRFLPKADLLRNFIADCDFNGITLYASNPTVWGNIVARCRNTGLGVYASSKPSVRNNILTANAVYNVFVSQTTRPSIKWNLIDHSPGIGVYLSPDSTTELRDNILLGNSTGLGYRDGMRMNFEYNDFFGNSLVNFYNIGRSNDLYDAGGTFPVSVAAMPHILYADPQFVRPDYDRPNLGDYGLRGGSALLTAGEYTSPVGLFAPLDVGTTSTLIGTEVH